MTLNDNGRPWRVGTAGISFGVLSVVWFGLISQFFAKGMEASTALMLALLSTLPFLGIAVLAAILCNFKYLEALAWPTSVLLLLIVGYLYYYLLGQAAVSLK